MGCFFALLVPFSGIDDYGDVACVFGHEFAVFLWLLSSFSERAVEVLDGVDLRCSRRSVLWLDLL